MRQLIQLRWIAVAGQLLAILVAHFALGVPLPLLRCWRSSRCWRWSICCSPLTLCAAAWCRGELSLALLLDMAALTAQLYLSGGADQSVHLALPAAGRARRDPAAAAGRWVAARVVARCVASLLTSACAAGALPPALCPAATCSCSGGGSASCMVAALLVLFITRISRNLRARDAYVAELRQHAVEEDGIVRMGLFASGAAHELGTPLRRCRFWSPTGSGCPRSPPTGAGRGTRRAAGEIEALQGDRVQHPPLRRRRRAARRWDRSRPRAFLDGRSPALAGAAPGGAARLRRAIGLAAPRIAAEPALRQAIWSLLDNAAEARPERSRCAARSTADELVAHGRDRGPGFTSDRSPTSASSTSRPRARGMGSACSWPPTSRAGSAGGWRRAIATGGGAEVRLFLPLAAAERRGDERPAAW